LVTVEYVEFLKALGTRHLRLGRLERCHPKGSGYIHDQIERCASLARFARVVSERPDKVDLYRPLGRELKHSYNHLGEARRVLADSGVLDALDEYTDEVLGQLNREVIPDYDVELLRHAGFEEPEAEIVLFIHYARSRMVGHQLRPSEVLRTAQERVEAMAEALETTDPEPESPTSAQAKPKKVFTGISKILGGAVTGLGNVLLGVGAIPSAGPSSLHLVIGSCGLAIAAVGQGIGDLRGE
jgi:hypothetical protein